jgi:uncharacterized protein YjgD (DUF1641 family)
MPDQVEYLKSATVDTRALSSLITELNIALRNCRAYPKGHPVVEASLRKVLVGYERLRTDQGEIVLGVTSEALMVGGAFLDKSNIVFRDFARVLFERGIGALVFSSGLNIQELTNLTVILSLKREDILRHGGIEAIWGKAHIASLTIRPVRYDLFATTDEDSISASQTATSTEGLWEQFAKRLTLGGPDSDGGAENDLDPEVLASMLNQQFEQGLTDKSEYSKAITDFMIQGEDSNSVNPSPVMPYEKLAAFVSNLNPELRRQFLNNSFNIHSNAGQTAAEGVISNLSSDAVLETLEDINQSRISVPPVIMGLLQRLARQSTPGQYGADSEISEVDELSNKLKTLFREHAAEEFTPDDYQRKLNYIISTDQIQKMVSDGTADLLATLENRQIENRIGEILINLVREGTETPEEREMLLQNLSDMFGFYLQTGDYGQLFKMVDQITDGTFPLEIQYRLKDEYARPEFLDEILNGLTIWGKPRYEDIRRLVHKIGSPFIETILDRLAEEKNMSVRRFFMDCLISMGPMTRVPIANRLYDTRWYFLRNLLIILSAQNDPSVVPIIQPLLNQSDSRLRHEVLKILVQFHDPQAEKQVLQDLGSQEHDALLAAILLAEKCRSQGVINKLLGLLSHGNLNQSEYEIKSAIVRSLAEIGRVEALPELAKILGSRSLLHSKILNSLKIDILNSLAHYPLNAAKPVLEHLSSGNNDVANKAREILKSISGKPS